MASHFTLLFSRRCEYVKTTVPVVNHNSNNSLRYLYLSCYLSFTSNAFQTHIIVYRDVLYTCAQMNITYLVLASVWTISFIIKHINYYLYGLFIYVIVFDIIVIIIVYHKRFKRSRRSYPYSTSINYSNIVVCLAYTGTNLFYIIQFIIIMYHQKETKT